MGGAPATGSVMPLTPSVGGWFGTGVFVGVGVLVHVVVGVGVLVHVAVGVGVYVDVGVGVLVGVLVGVGVFVGVRVAVFVDPFRLLKGAFARDKQHKLPGKALARKTEETVTPPPGRHSSAVQTETVDLTIPLHS